MSIIIFHTNFWVKLQTSSFNLRVILTLSQFLKNNCLIWLQFLFLNFLCYSSACKVVWQHYPVMKYFFLVQIWKWYIPSCSFKLKQKFQYQIWIWRSFPPSKWEVRIYLKNTICTNTYVFIICAWEGNTRYIYKHVWGNSRSYLLYYIKHWLKFKGIDFIALLRYVQLLLFP